MSTKIYVAYRLKAGADLWPVIRRIKRRGSEEVRKVLRALYRELADGVDTSSERYARVLALYDGNEAVARLVVAGEGLKELYKKATETPYRSEFNFDVSVGIWELAGRQYLIPFCDMCMGDVLNFLRRDPDLEAYGYWNNTDRPRSISVSRWHERRDVWDAIHDNGWQDHVVVEVCRFDGFWLVDPLREMVRDLRRNRRRGMLADKASYDDVKAQEGSWPRLAEAGAHQGEWVHRNRSIATFRCAQCRQRVPWSRGCHDDRPEWCDDCWMKANPSRPSPDPTASSAPSDQS